MSEMIVVSEMIG